MSNNEKSNQTNETATQPRDNPLLTVQTADPATQNRNFGLDGQEESNDK